MTDLTSDSPQLDAAAWPASPPRPLGRGSLAVVMLARLALNLQFRIVYPFMPAISRGLGVPLETATLLLSVRAGMGAASPLFGLLSDHLGRRRLMLLGLAILVGGSLLALGAPSFGWAMLAFALLGLCKPAYDPAGQAFVSDRVPYERRGRVLGFLELSWSAAWLLGVPATGFLIAAFGWRSPFAGVAALGALALLLTAVGRQDGKPAAGGLAAPAKIDWTAVGRQIGLALSGGAAVLLVVNFLQMLALENVFVVYGAWLEEQFRLNLTTLGLVSIVVAVAEFLAESASAALADRVGKRRAVLGGLCLSVLAYLLLPRLAGNLAGALAGVSLMFLGFEFAVVSTLSLISGLTPGARATALALNTAAMSLGRVAASLSGPRLWSAGGLALNAGSSCAIAVFCALLLWCSVREQKVR